MDPPDAERREPLLALVDEPRAKAAPAVLGMDDADRVARVVVLLDPPERDDASVLLPEPRVGGEIHAREPGRHVRHAEPRRPAEELCLILSQEGGNGRQVVPGHRANAHGTSESRFSPRPAKLCSSTSG